MSEPWFDPNVFGAYAGATLGILGGILGTSIGILGGVFLPRGKGIGVLKGALIGMTVLGLLLLAAGLYALAVGQPFGIWYVLVLSGVIFSIVAGGNLVGLGFLIRLIERRKMEAKDLRHG